MEYETMGAEEYVEDAVASFAFKSESGDWMEAYLVDGDDEELVYKIDGFGKVNPESSEVGVMRGNARDVSRLAKQLDPAYNNAESLIDSRLEGTPASD